ncbi:MAG: HAD family acid phosphatase [Kofleriaceae bacterium]
MNRALATVLAILPCAALAACEGGGDPYERGDGVDVLGDDDKGDGAGGVEVVGRLAPGTVDGQLTSATPRVAYVFPAKAGARIDLEVTRAGTSSGLDTVLRVHGPRGVDGTYRTTLAEDADAGYGRLSKISGLTAPADGFYLAEVALAPGATISAPRSIRLALTCGDGACASTEPVAPPGLELRWVDGAAEYRALAAQAYRGATARLEALATAGALPAAFAVVLDVDETSLSNVRYQAERAVLGVGYSSASWLAWTQRRAATAIPGVAGFLAAVKAHGGTVAFVTNRKAGAECTATRANLLAEGLPVDGLYCRGGTSDKNPRFQAIEAGTAAGLPALPIVMYIGDNIADFPGLSQDLAGEPEDAYAEFGADLFVIPNPMYGSWEATT